MDSRTDDKNGDRESSDHSRPKRKQTRGARSPAPEPTIKNGDANDNGRSGSDRGTD